MPWLSWPRPWLPPAPTTWVAVDRAEARVVAVVANARRVMAAERWAEARAAVAEKWVAVRPVG